MKTGLAVVLTVAALRPPGIVAQNAAAEEIHMQAYPYYGFKERVAGSAATVEQFLPLTGARGLEPNTSKVLSLQDADVFVHNGPCLETYGERPVRFEDLPHAVLAKASDGLARVPAAGLNDMIRSVLEEHGDGRYTAEEAVEAIEDILDAEEVRGILDKYGSGIIAAAEALSHILSLADGEHAKRGSSGGFIGEIRKALEEIRGDDPGHEGGRKAIRD